MEPATILSVVKAAGSAAKGAHKLYNFLRDAKNFDSTAEALAHEVKTLATACEVVSQTLGQVRDDYLSTADADHSPTGSIDELWSCLGDQLNACQRTISSMESVLGDDILSNTASAYWERVQKQFLLSMKLPNISEARERIKSHTTGVQMVMGSISIQISYLIPRRTDQQLQSHIATLAELTQTYAKTKRAEDADDIGGSHQEDASLLAAKRVVHDGSTFYEGSLAGGSTFGGNNPFRAHDIHRWLSLADRIDHGQATDPSTGTPSIFSVTKPPDSSITDDVEPVHHVHSHSTVAAPRDLSDEESDHDDVDLAQHSIDCGREAFARADYKEANVILQEALQIVTELSIRQQKICDTDDVRYMLSHCAFHLDDAARARLALLNVIEKLSMSSAQDDTQKLRLCETSHLLAQACVKLGRIEEARTACQNAMHVRQRLLGNSHESVYESRALMSLICKLQGNPTRAKLYLSRIPESQIHLIDKFEELAIEASDDLPDTKQTPPPVDESSAPDLMPLPLPPRPPPDNSAVAERRSTSVEVSEDVQSVRRSDSADALSTLGSGTNNGRYTYRFRNRHLLKWAEEHDYKPQRLLSVAARKAKAEFCKFSIGGDMETMLMRGDDSGALARCHRPNRSELSSLGLSLKSAKEEVFDQLRCATMFGVLDVVKALIAKGAQTFRRDAKTRSILYYAALSGSIEVTEFLIGAIGPSFMPTLVRDQESPLAVAITLNHVDICDLLLRHGAQIETITPRGCSILHMICASTHSVRPYLLTMCGRGNTLLHHGAWVDQTHSFVDTWKTSCPDFDVDFGSKLKVKPHRVKSILIDPVGVAVLAGTVNAVEWALTTSSRQLGPFITSTRRFNDETQKSISAAALAAAAGRTEMVTYLLARDEPVSAQERGTEALKMAVINTQLATATVLLEAGYRLEDHVKAWAFKNSFLTSLGFSSSYQAFVNDSAETARSSGSGVQSGGFAKEYRRIGGSLMSAFKSKGSI